MAGGRAVLGVKRVVGREMLSEELLEVCGALLALLGVLVVRPRFVVEVTRAGDVGVLQGVRLGAELTGAGLGERYEI